MDEITIEEILISVYETISICKYILLFIIICFIMVEIYSLWVEGKKMNKFQVLVGVVSFDVLITLFAVGYLGAIEINPLCYNFTHFMIIKILLTGSCLFGFYKLREHKFVGWCVVLLIIFYSLVGINNLWATLYYLYY